MTVDRRRSIVGAEYVTEEPNNQSEEDLDGRWSQEYLSMAADMETYGRMMVDMRILRKVKTLAPCRRLMGVGTCVPTLE